MAFLHLTDELVAVLSSSAAQEEFYDSGFTVGGSFGVRVSGLRGTKAFFLVYSLHGRRKRMTLGRYPELSVDQARSIALRLVQEVRSGRDPAAEARLRPHTPLFRLLAERFLEHSGTRCSTGTLREYRRIIERELLPLWGDRLARDITARDLELLLRSVLETRGKPVMASRIRSLAHNVFNWAFEEGHLESNPFSSVRMRLPARPPARVLPEDHFPLFWSALERESPAIRAVFGLMLLTGQSPGKVMTMRWADLALDVWLLESGGFSFQLHLTAPALELLRQVRLQTGSQEYVFASARSKHLVYLRKAARRLSARMGSDPAWSPGDLRRTAEAGLRRLRVRPDVIEYILGRRSVLTRLGFGRLDNDYPAAAREALRRWSRQCAPQLQPPLPESGGKIVPLFPSRSPSKR